MFRRLTASISTLAAVIALAGGSLPIACLIGGGNVACPGNCLCHSTPETCPIGCAPTYAFLPDGGGTGAFSCLNPQPIDAQMPEASSGPPLACALPDGAIVDATIPEADLPSGACSGSESCSASVEVTGCPGLVDGYTCSCVDGTWGCEMTSAGTMPCAVDAAADASP